MAVAGYAGLPRFLAAGERRDSGRRRRSGVARAGARAFPAASMQPRLALATVAALLAAVAGFGLRAADVPGDLRRGEPPGRAAGRPIRDRRPGRRRAPALLRRKGPPRQPPYAPTALAWKLDRPLASVRYVQRPRYGVALSTRPLPGKPHAGGPLARHAAPLLNASRAGGAVAGAPIAEGAAKRRPSTWGRAAATGPARLPLRQPSHRRRLGHHPVGLLGAPRPARGRRCRH